jgi:hypothetical protein
MALARLVIELEERDELTPTLGSVAVPPTPIILSSCVEVSAPSTTDSRAAVGTEMPSCGVEVVRVSVKWL